MILDLLRPLFCGDASSGARAPFEPRSLASFEEVIAHWAASSMLYSSLKRRGLDHGLGAEALARLQRAHAATTAQNLELLHEAKRVLRALKEAGLPAVPLKGIALFLHGVHRDFGARPTCDIDILTRRRDRNDVTRMLQDLGYRQSRRDIRPKHLPGFHRGELLVEVHEWAYWSLRGGSPVGVDGMMDRAGGARLDQAVVHVVHHLFEGSVREPWLVVKTLWDMNEVRLHAERHPQLLEDIGEVAERVGLTGRLGALWGALARILEHPCPAPWSATAAQVDEVLDACRPCSVESMHALALRYHLQSFFNYPSWMKARMLRAAFLPGRTQMESIYDLAPESPWVWPAYALRPVHLLWRAAEGAAQIARKRLKRS